MYTQIGNCPLHEAVSKNRAHAVTLLLAAPNGTSVVNSANKVNHMTIVSELLIVM